MKNFNITESEKQQILKLHRTLKEQTEPKKDLFGTEQDPNFLNFTKVVELCLKGKKNQIRLSKDGKRYFYSTKANSGNMIYFYSDMTVTSQDGKSLGKYRCPEAETNISTTAASVQTPQTQTPQGELTQSQKDALSFISQQGFVVMPTPPSEFKVKQGEFIKLDLTKPDGEVESKYPSVFTDNVKEEFTTQKFPKGFFVYQRTGVGQSAAKGTRVEINKENCRTAVFALEDMIDNPNTTIMTPEQRRTHIQTVRKCMDPINKLGVFNIRYRMALKKVKNEFLK